MVANDEKGRVSSILQTTESGLVASIVGVLGLIYLLDMKNLSFFGQQNIISIVHLISLSGVLAVGAAVVIISGGIDLSVGAVVALSSVVAARLATRWLPYSSADGSPPAGVVVAAIGLTLLMGLTIGLFHAFLINKFKLPPFIATLATMSGLRSLSSILAENKSINIRSEVFRALGRYPSYTFATFATVAVAASVMMGATVLGRHIYALGGNEAAARLSGLRVERLKAITYGLSGLLAALAGLLYTGKTGQATPQLGLSYELFAITSAVVGGCSLAGGVGSIRGTVLGLVLLQVLIRGTGLVAYNSTQIEGLVLGTVIILAVAINQRFRPKL